VEKILPKVLVISRHFPPIGPIGGSIRLVKFLKYTSLKGWQFIVLTQDLEKTVIPEEKLSTSLLEDIPAETQIERVSAPFKVDIKRNRSLFYYKLIVLKRYIIEKLLGNTSIFWGIKILIHGILNFKKWDIDLIYSVSPPFTDAFIGCLLALISQKPYVLDLKDDWVGSPDFQKKNIYRQQLENWLERLIISSASAIVTVTPQSHQLYSQRYARAGFNDIIYYVPNGSDLEEYKELWGRKRRIETRKFTILSAVWGFRKNYRDLTAFLLSLDVFLNKHPEAKQKIDIIFLGNSLSSDYKDMITESGLAKIINETGALDRKEFVESLWKADLFLLIQPINNTTAISGTLYEYWATGKAPVLLIAEKGASTSLVERFDLGMHFHFSEIEKCASYIETVYRAYQNGRPVWINTESIEQFDRRALAMQMENIWHRALSRHRE